MTTQLRSIAGFRLVCRDRDRLTQFYAALGFTIGAVAPIAAAEMAMLGLAGSGTRLAMRLGPTLVELDSYDQPGRAYPADTTASDSRFQHLAIVTTDIDAAWDRAVAAGATPISRGGPVMLPASSGGVSAVKFRDQEGHPLEFLQFPAGSNAAWPGTGMLGIDHSAICVADVDRAIAFFAAHGLTQGERGVNQGPTQVALDGIDAVVVDVVPLLPARAPAHLELLGYHGDCGAVGALLMANDIAATRIVWHADRDALMRDCDGHLHQLVETARG